MIQTLLQTQTEKSLNINTIQNGTDHNTSKFVRISVIKFIIHTIDRDNIEFSGTGKGTVLAKSGCAL